MIEVEDIVRYDREPSASSVHAAAIELPEGHAVILSETGVGTPVWLPEELHKLFGPGMRRVSSVKRAPCPKSCGRVVAHYVVDGPGELAVAECVEHKFMWYQSRL